jgi:hypothetical protein
MHCTENTQEFSLKELMEGDTMEAAVQIGINLTHQMMGMGVNWNDLAQVARAAVNAVMNPRVQ